MSGKEVPSKLAAGKTRSRSERQEVERVAMAAGRGEVLSACFPWSFLSSVVAKMTA